MDSYITGKTIKRLRKKKQLTQSQLAHLLCVSDKTISKWETSKGLPDISLIEPLAKALDISVIELMNGSCVKNQNMSGNMTKTKWYVCPICGNIIHAMGEIMVSCCGVTLMQLEAENASDEHQIRYEMIENEFYVTCNHPMTKDHYLSFFAYVTYNKIEIIKLYPEGNAEARFQQKGSGILYAYCNKHGLIKKNI